ncbi:SusC/RagA family TonB-linked outer membrane protein [Aureivirga sp. CE67]|uniref:SusC/RagA family TonB-linked outer membrane protein n=1 Tax=Aureivirga sp. CE67 TaxID=1788983 RepID=UPI0018CB5CF3|nr:SusC/RagA family TonB-linked outer membrane protein [Aureivirga sp. CE67]
MKTKFNGIITLLLVLVGHVVFAQQMTVTGTVSDGDGALPSASVVIEGTSTGTETDFDGNYSIKVEKGQTLIFSYVGYNDKSVKVGESSTINVTLENGNVLDELDLGYVKKKRGATAAGVSTVSAQDIQEVAQTTNIANALQGKASGVNVTAANGQPGQTAFVRIRGVGSISSGQEPLYIVDGVPIDENALNLINNSDIETMSVLKDAGAAAIYGARASNGVVIITTKGGKREQEARFSVTAQYGMTERLDGGIELMNADQKLRYERELGVGVGAGITTTAEWNDLVANDHDWRNTILRDGTVKSLGFNVNGGTEKTSYFVSLQNDSDTGVIRGVDGFDKTTARVNLNFDAKDWLTFDVKSSVSYTKSVGFRDRNNVQSPFVAARTYNPYETVFLEDENGDYLLDEKGEPRYNLTHAGYNIIEAIRKNPEQDEYIRLFGSVSAEAKILENLTYTPKLGTNYNIRKSESSMFPSSILSQYVSEEGKPGNKAESGSYSFTYNFQNIIRYNTTFNEKHNLSVLALTEYISNDFRNWNVRAVGFSKDDINVLDAGAEPDRAGGTRSQKRTFSLAGNVDYDYDGKYIASATVRRDGSSVFGEGNRFGTFFSGSAAWNLHTEDFLKDNKVINALKLRASYGTLGNDQIGRYASLGLTGYISYANEPSSAPGQVANPDLKWEQKAITDIAIEYGLFNNRLRGVVDYYKSVTSDLLLTVPLPAEGGRYSRVENVGEIQTQGIELELAGDILRGYNGINWTVGGNIAFADTKVNELVDGEPYYETGLILEEGQEIYTHYLVRYAGVNPANGHALYYDVDGNVTDQFSGEDAVALDGKTVNADFTGTVFTRASWKGLELSASFYFKYGNYILNGRKWSLESDGNNVADNQQLSAFNYWRQPGDTGVLPSPTQFSRLNSNQLTDRFLQDGSYIRLRTLKLSYNIPQKLVEKAYLSKVNVYVQGQNLWTYAPNYEGDPEIGIQTEESYRVGETRVPGAYDNGSYPTTRSYMFGIDISF